MKQVKCIKQGAPYFEYEGMFIGKVCNLHSEYKDGSGKLIYNILNNGLRGYYADNFIIVGCPCDVKNCLAKHNR